MIVYVLSHCTAEKNYAPSVFTDRDKAEKEMTDAFEACVYKDLDDTGAEVQDSVSEFIKNDSSASVTYEDDTYDIWEIFEVEVK